MTKDWETVRADVCRLYHEEGKSLSQVRSILLRERKFEASVRAFRFKVEEWKLKKSEAGHVSPASQIAGHHSSRETRVDVFDDALQEHWSDEEHSRDGRIDALNDAAACATPTVLERALNRFHEHEIDIKKRGAAHLTALEVAIEAGLFENAILLIEADARHGGWDRSARRGVVRRFLERAWPDLSRPGATEGTTAARCFALFIPEDHWYGERISSICDTDCDSLESLAAYHAPNMLPWDILIQQNPDPEELVQAVLMPCRHRCRKTGAMSPSELLRDLSARGFRHDPESFNALSYVLNYAPDDEKAELMSTLLDLEAVKDMHHISEFDGYRPLDCLVVIDEPLRWQLAEILLSRDAGINDRRPGDLSATSDCVFVWHPGMYYNQYTTHSYDDHLSRYVDDPDDISDAMRCVLHVLTKALIEDTVPEPKAGTRRMRCLDALKIRKQFSLQDIPVDTTFLIEVFEGGDCT